MSLYAMAGRVGGPDRPDHQGMGETVNSIVSYIPAEVIAVYVAGAMAIGGPDASRGAGQWVLLVVMAVLTPVALWAMYALREREAGRVVPLRPDAWPWQTMLIALAAFLLWAFALPDTPFERFGWFRPGLAAVVLLVGTMVIGLVAPLLPEMGDESARARPAT